jgi:predicted lysophospholipase L1 biosynthesis ABC-type transport system permease subunit
MMDGYISVVLKVAVVGMLFALVSSLISVISTIQMKPVSILRGVNTLPKGKRSLSILGGILVTICLCVISSLYLKNMVGALIIIIAAFVYIIFTTLAKFLIKVVSLLFCVKRRTTVVKIAAKYLRKNYRKFSMIVLVLSICVSIVGTILIMYNSIQPSLENQIKNSLGYDALFKIGTEQEQKVNEVLKDCNIDSYFESAILDFTLKEINGVPVEQKDAYEYSMDCMYGNVSYVNDKIVEGNALSENSEKREVVVAQDFYKQYKMNIGDMITIQSGQEEYDFTVIGVRETEKIKTGQLYTSQVNVSDIMKPNVIRYYVKCNGVESFVEDLNGAFDNIVVLNIQDISAPYADTINKELLILKLISVLCIGSAIFLVFNILTVTYIGDKRQYLIYGMYGADKQIKRMMIFIQGIILGIAGAMLSVIIGIFEALLLETSLRIHINYDVITLIEVCILSIICAEGSTLLISSTLVNYNDYKVLRSE